MKVLLLIFTLTVVCKASDYDYQDVIKELGSMLAKSQVRQINHVAVTMRMPKMSTLYSRSKYNYTVVQWYTDYNT